MDVVDGGHGGLGGRPEPLGEQGSVVLAVGQKRPVWA
jgi:hypothetical protein